MVQLLFLGKSVQADELSDFPHDLMGVDRVGIE